MAIIGSLLWGKEGSYQVLGVEARFQKADPGSYKMGGGIIGQLASCCQGNPVFRFATLGYLHVFIHEMGHAIASQLLGGVSDRTPLEVTIHTDTGTGETKGIATGSRWRDTAVFLAGPLADIIFSIGIILGSLALHSYITLPISLFFTAGALFWITGELLYALISSLQNDHGDFGQIRHNGPFHLLVATAAIVGVVALGVIGSLAVMA